MRCSSGLLKEIQSDGRSCSFPEQYGIKQQSREGQKSSKVSQGCQTAKRLGRSWLGLCRQCPGFIMFLPQVSCILFHYHSLNLQLVTLLITNKKTGITVTRASNKTDSIFPLFLLKTLQASHPGNLHSPHNRIKSDCSSLPTHSR